MPDGKLMGFLDQRQRRAGLPEVEGQHMGLAGKENGPTFRVAASAAGLRLLLELPQGLFQVILVRQGQRQAI